MIFTPARSVLQLVSLALALATAACSSPVTKTSRDTTGQFDGKWKAKIEKASTPQTVQNWRFQCADLSRDVDMAIADGEVSMGFGDELVKTYISKDGTFNFTVPVGSATASISSDIGLSNPNVSYIIRGNLGNDPAKGTLVVGYAEVGYAGCTSKINYRRN